MTLSLSQQHDRSALPPPLCHVVGTLDRRIRVSVPPPAFEGRNLCANNGGTTPLLGQVPPCVHQLSRLTAWSAGFSSTSARTPASPAPKRRAPASTLRPARVRAPASLPLQARTQAPESPTPHPTRAEPTHHRHATPAIESRRVRHDQRRGRPKPQSRECYYGGSRHAKIVMRSSHSHVASAQPRRASPAYRRSLSASPTPNHVRLSL